MKDTANANCRELLDVLIAQGVRHLVASPGSRNAPLLIGASARKKLNTRMVNDERAAGFIALGLAMSTQTPVALCCTSGTALYNYAPAIAEAYYQKIPLIVISADRPAQWIEQDDSQTLRQFDALSKIVKKSYDIPAEIGMTTPCRNKEYSTEREWYANRVANEAVLTANEGRPGPVHINIQFAEPLNGTIDYEPRTPRTIKVIRNTTGVTIETLKKLSALLSTKKVMVIAGFMLPDYKLNKALMEFSKLPNVTVLCETISNLHLDGHSHMIDTLLVRMTEEQKRELRPDIVITIGGALVSRMIKEYLRESEGTEHWTLRDTELSVDCLQRLTTHIDVTPTQFFSGIGSMTEYLMRNGLKIESTYKAEWQALRDKIWEENLDERDRMPWSEYTALGTLFDQLSKYSNLFLSNGTCVRYAQLLLDKIPHACYCNRGVSGIDGTNATAIGTAIGYPGYTLLVTGDMSFSYYTEVLNPKNCPADLRIAVVNNRGGGIFRFIRTTRNLEQREEYFCSDPETPIEGLAKAYGRPYMKADDPKSMAMAIEHLMTIPNSIIEIVADKDESANTLIRLLDRNTK